MLGYARSYKFPHTREPSKGHGKCTWESCVIAKIGTCNCDSYKPSLESIIGSLSAGKIPVVQCPPPEYNELRCSDSSTTPYVAISHV